MKIAYIGIKGLPSKAGADRVVEAVVQRLNSQHELTVYCHNRITPRDVRIAGVRLVRLPALPGKHLQATSLFLFSALHALVLGDYDLVHVHNAEACFVVPLLRLRYRVMATSHGPAYARQKWGGLSRRLIHMADYFYGRFPQLLTSVSAPLAQEYERRYARTVHYLPNGVEGDPSVDAEAASATLLANGVVDDYVLFAAGRLDPTKGCHLLLDAYKSVKPGCPLVVVGSTATAPEYGQELARMAGDRVAFIPFIDSNAELLGIVSKARLFVFPSTVEAMSMMLLEVASLGVPTVCSDIPENTGVLGDTAVYFSSGDSGDLASKLKWALDHPDQMKELGRQAQARVKRDFSWDRIATQYCQLYQQSLAS